METTITGHFALTPLEARNLRKAIKAHEAYVARLTAEADAIQDAAARTSAYARVAEAAEFLAKDRARLAAG